MTAFSAECEMQSGIVRLNAYGEGKSAYLGVMVPENGRLVLRKKLSRDAMKEFPQKIEYAANCKLEKSSREPESGLLWFSTSEGFLTAFDGAQSLIAIPADMKRLPITRIINGKEYAIFPGKRKV